MAMAKANVPVDAFSPATVKEAASGDGGEGMGLRVLGFFLLFFFCSWRRQWICTRSCKMFHSEEVGWAG